MARQLQPDVENPAALQKVNKMVLRKSKDGATVKITNDFREI
jgi:hypothetical protein